MTDAVGTGLLALDPRALLQVAERLSAELDSEKLVRQLLRVGLELTAAERAQLRLDREGLLYRATPNAGGDVVLERLPLEPATLPEPFVERSAETVASADGATLMVPLRSPRRAVGVLLLERPRGNGAFTPEHVRVLKLLSTQMAIALENSLLFEERRGVGVAQGEAQLRAERDRYLRMIFRQFPGTLYATDPALVFKYVTGNIQAPPIDAKQLVGLSIYDFLGTRDPTEPAIANHLAALAGTRRTFDYRLFDRWFEVQVEPLRGPDDAVVGCVGSAFDVTERYATRERLARSEARFAEAQRTAHVGSFEWDMSSDVVSWTEELHRIYGLEPGEFEGSVEGFFSRVHPDDLQHTRDVIFAAVREKKAFVYDHRVVRPDGTARVLHTRGDVILDASGTPLRVVGTCWDVTDLVEATASRERSLSLLQATLDATADGILVSDPAGKVTLINRRLEVLWGLPRSTTAAIDLETVLDAMARQVEDPETFRAGILSVQAQTESVDVVRLKDGRVFERYSRPQHIGEAVVGRVWSFRDISDRERLLRRAVFIADATRLLASLDLYRALEGVAHLAVPYLGDGCAIDLFGDGAPRRLVALSRDPSRPISPEVHPSVLSAHTTIYQVDSISYLGVPLMVKGRIVGAITLSAPAHRRYAQADFEVAEELGRRAALSIENAQLYERAQDAVRARDDFLSVASHEIRGPITALHLAVQLLQAERLSNDARPRAFGIIQREDRRLGRFVDELLDLTRIRTGRMHFDLEEVDLGQIARDATGELDLELSRSGSPLSLTVEGNVRGIWDPFRVEQIVANLLSNAIKFGLGKPIEVRVATHDHHAVFEVKDHGIGIGDTARGRIFTPFERAVSARHYGGLGLGLYIVKTIAEGLGGSVALDSHVGEGSTFTVELPQEQPRA